MAEKKKKKKTKKPFKKIKSGSRVMLKNGRCAVTRKIDSPRSIPDPCKVMDIGFTGWLLPQTKLAQSSRIAGVSDCHRP